ncbi:GntR family transcriptional regulator [Defluviitalea phaphyphila]|uniref:GntR family transcriptional regulator n=1 Tax=Defluviitalea phaphyphila TaxID=1473580 RepID=UPI0007301521|nr:GntR family transcriptional regulator [Defluviitalea phaphyphila]
MRYDLSKEVNDKYSLRGRVFHKIREDILEGKYEPGKPIRETAISQDLGVSRTPVREALKQLELEGLVTSIPNKGTVVTGITEQDIIDIYAIRSLIEGLAARWAAIKITDKQLKELEEIIELTEFYTQKHNMEHLHELDTRFHEVIYEASNSKPLRHILSDFHHYVQKARMESIATPGRAQKSTQEHKAILEAIKNRDPDKAEKLTNLHVKNVAKNVMKYHKKADY